MEIDPRALTEDGYLKDQDYLKNFPYGRYPTSFNGCGWVAIYNVEHAIGQSIAAEAVYEVMRKMLPYDGTQGTPFPTMVRYYAERNIPVARIYGSGEELVRIVRECGAPRGILRYIEGREPHYIAFVRVSDETPARYRFFNAADGKEDFVETMEYFRREHLGGRRVVRLLLPGEEREDARARGKNHIVDAKWSEHLPRRCVQYPVLRRKNSFEPLSGIGRGA
ncbi:hypothetical protein [Stomatobaculum longum]|jgi:hypothetical protein